jgi:2-phospho-L-lactate guanylyltransferase
MTDNALMSWSVLMPVKVLARAKSRLAGLAGPRRSEHGAAHASARWPGSGTAALSADLPALRPAEIGRALRAAAAWPTAFVADAAGDGTTLYAAAAGAAFRPAFGLASRARHSAGGAAELDLDGIPGLRRDVDTPADLRRAVALGLGLRSAPLAAELLRCVPRGR